MRAAFLATLVVLGSPVAISAQSSASGEAAQRAEPSEGESREPGPIVLILDPGPLRINADRLVRTISRALLRDVIRLTDPRAHDAIDTLTIAYDAGRRWHVRFAAQGKSATVVENAVPPGAIDSYLADACRRAIVEVETSQREPAVPTPPPPADRVRGAFPQSAYFVWSHEILDPFVDAPRSARREIAIFSEVIDPFAPAAARRAAFTEVLDPWGF